ncbi:MAG: hypothetical protein N3D11_03850 [Candidatus Sumerlaeia bacterium]|nr:hypothetical protein [Candidatus Sumerlaeia bacterium]
MRSASDAIRLAARVFIAAVCMIVPQSAKAADSADLRNTVVTPVLDAEIPPGKNLIYCAAFQPAWEELRQNLKASLPEAPTAVRALDRSLVGKPDLPEDACVALGGLAGDLPDKIRAGVRKKFGAAAPPLDDLATTLAAYALLQKTVQFPQEFALHDKPLNFSAGAVQFPAAAFGFAPDTGGDLLREKLRAQVGLVDSNPETGQFVVRLQSRSPDDEIILARITPEKSLLQTIEAVSVRIAKGQPAPLAAGDTLAIPQIGLDIRHVFTEISRYVGTLTGRPGLAVQQIHFTLGEKSIAVKSETQILAAAAPRRLVFDQPFLLWLRKTGSRYPYLAIWVGHPEILRAAGGPPKAAPQKPAAPTPSTKPTQSTPAPPAKPGLDGKALVEARCADCHALSKVYSAKYNSAEWTATVKRMVSKGAKLNAAERKAVVDYLSSR